MVGVADLLPLASHGEPLGHRAKLPLLIPERLYDARRALSALDPHALRVVRVLFYARPLVLAEADTPASRDDLDAEEHARLRRVGNVDGLDAAVRLALPEALIRLLASADESVGCALDKVAVLGVHARQAVVAVALDDSTTDRDGREVGVGRVVNRRAAHRCVLRAEVHVHDVADLGAVGRFGHVRHEARVPALGELRRDGHVGRLDVAPADHVAHPVGRGRAEPGRLEEQVHGIQLGLGVVVLAHAENQGAAQKEAAGVGVDGEADRFGYLDGLINQIAASNDHVRPVEVVVFEPLQEAVGIDLSLAVGAVDVHRVHHGHERAEALAPLAAVREGGVEVHAQEVVADIELVGEVQGCGFIERRVRVALDGAAVLDVAHEVDFEPRLARDAHEVVGGVERPYPAISHWRAPPTSPTSGRTRPPTRHPSASRRSSGGRGTARRGGRAPRSAPRSS